MSIQNAQEIHEEDTVTVPGLAAVLGNCAGIKVLSLDCFDTLLWRRVHRPTDVFFDMQRRPAWARIGLNARQRVSGEQLARKIADVRNGSREVTLRDIYRTAIQGASDALVAELEEDELQAECDACFALPEAVALLRDAAARGIPVVITSDTYLREAQLRRLLAHCLPEDAYPAISRVIVSCENGASKQSGLFDRLTRMGILPAADTLHIGDNPGADLFAPIQAGMQARVLFRFPKHIIHQMDDCSSALRMMDPSIGSSRGTPSPWHSLLARMDHEHGDIERELGQASLGPIMHGFASWILDRRLEALQAGKRLKIAFLMRDGEFPRRACEALAGQEIGKPIYISRFAAFAASFRNQDDIDYYLGLPLHGNRCETILKQLGITGPTAAEILRKVERAGGGFQAFLAQVRTPAIIQRILAWSSGFRDRMRKHLEAELGLQAGDTLALVDLGYYGNAQRALGPIARGEWGVELVGWYLMCFSQAGDTDRHALLDDTRCGEQAFLPLVRHIALLEALCAATTGSVRGYAADGTPELEPRQISDEQNLVLSRIQGHALAFIQDAARHAPTCSDETLSAAILGVLTRLIFLPTAEELALFESFMFEENLGLDITSEMSNMERAMEEMRRDGIFFSVKMRTKRRLVAHELRYVGLEYSLASMAIIRNQLALRSSDWSLRRESLPLLYLTARGASRKTAAPHSTYDGCFRAHIPLMQSCTHVGIGFGEEYAWLQLIEATVLPLAGLHGQEEAIDVMPYLVHEQLVGHAGGIIECKSKEAFCMLPIDSIPFDGPWVLDLVYRPILKYLGDATGALTA